MLGNKCQTILLINKMVQTGSSANRSVDDVILTRYACYLVAQNGDLRKPQIAFAQKYFAVQTRRAELIEQRLLEVERVKARVSLKIFRAKPPLPKNMLTTTQLCVRC